MANSQNNSPAGQTDPKVIAIVAYLTLIGWLVALVLQNNNKNELSSFHLRQALGIFLLVMVSSFVMVVPLLGWLAGMAGYIVAFVMWIIGLLGAINAEQKLSPILGDKFQEWFKAL